ncbi:MAG TPA: hypothetical protein PLP19_21920 [bacterium]|nr:hypothetical protein [bacterium]HPN46157.1 hypothetical protein [bacterium]
MNFNRTTDYLALDFDGVVINSVEECLFVSFNAYEELTGSAPITSLKHIAPKIIDEFKRMRNFIRAGADFVYIIMAISTNIKITSQQEFDDFCHSHKELEKTFFDTFYKHREQLSSGNPELWLKLNPLYHGMQDFLLQYPDKERLFIITTKKIFFVQKILSFYNIPFIDAHLFHADKTRSKKNIILELLDKYNIDPHHFWFIDDQVDTLIQVRDIQINCLLAEWGYNDSEQVLLGKQHHIPAINLDDLKRIFVF